MNQDELSIKAQNVLRRIGGLAGLEAYVQSGKSLVSLVGVGPKTVQELSSFLKKKGNNIDDKLVNTKEYLNSTSNFSPSVKCQNVIARMGGIEGLDAYLKSGKSLYNIPGVGTKTINEIELYIKSYTDNSNFDSDETQIQNLLNSKYFNFLLNFYAEFKNEAGLKMTSYLSEFERKFRFDEDIYHKSSFFIFYFSKDFKFPDRIVLKKRDYNSLIEKHGFIKSLINKILNGTDFNLNENILIKNIDQCIKEENNLDFQLRLDLPHNEKTKIDFFEWLLFQILSKSIKNRSKLFQSNLITEEISSIKEKNKNEKHILEQIRLAKNSLNKQIKETIHSLKKNTELKKNINNPFIPEEFWFELENHLEILYYKEKIIVTKFFIKSIYQNLLEDTHISASSFLIKNRHSSKVFKDVNDNIFMTKEFVNRTKFEKLIEYLEENIIAFESVAFDYNLEILIKRFYIENELELEKNYFLKLTLLIEKIKSLSIPVNYRLLKKQENEENNNNTINIIEQEMSSIGEPLSTKDIILVLESKKITKKRLEVLKLMNTHNQVFTMLGYGIWGLKEWESRFKYKGTIRDIVCQMLQESELPLHLNTIYRTINNHRKISYNSLISNLKLSEGIIIFFNCKYIGLKNKTYDQFWFNLPKINVLKFVHITKSEMYTKETKIKMLVNKGIPIEYAEFFTENQINN